MSLIILLLYAVVEKSMPILHDASAFGMKPLGVQLDLDAWCYFNHHTFSHSKLIISDFLRRSIAKLRFYVAFLPHRSKPEAYDKPIICSPLPLDVN